VKIRSRKGAKLKPKAQRKAGISFQAQFSIASANEEAKGGKEDETQGSE
jgi:hypothetical protein